MRIEISTIPGQAHRYPTAGDWYERDGTLQISVSKMGNEDHEFLVAVHELIEAYLCRKHGISEESVTAFDVAFKGDGEPGDDKDAPYYAEHQTASAIEHQVALALGVNWTNYVKAIDG